MLALSSALLMLIPRCTVLGQTTTLAADVPTEKRAKIIAAAPDKPHVKPAKERRLLVYTACKGFVHPAIPVGTEALRAMSQKTGAFKIDVSDDPAVFRPESLKRFDAVCFNNTTGELFEEVALKQSLLDFVRAGGGIVGIHAATDCFYQWPEFGALLGGYFDGHPWNADSTVTLKIEEPKHPLVAVPGIFPAATFEISDEIYQFKAPYSRDRIRVLLSLDTAKTDMKRPGIQRSDGDFGVSWVRNFGQGRVFYCALGHRDEIFWTPAVLRHYLAGIQFALGDLPADALPSASFEEARVGAGAPGSGADVNGGSADALGGDRDGPRWATLFNGRDLAGWIAKPGSWAVEDGALTRKGGGDIWTEQAFSDFELELEFRLAPGTNSGIFFRTANIADPVQTGIELQVLDSAGKAEPGKSKAGEPEIGKHDCGAIYDCLAPAKNVVKPPGEWNRVTLTVRGPKIVAVLNGEPVIDMDLDRWTEPGRNPDGTPNKYKTAFKDMPRRGRIGFQDHGKPVWYREIRVRVLE